MVALPWFKTAKAVDRSQFSCDLAWVRGLVEPVEAVVAFQLSYAGKQRGMHEHKEGNPRGASSHSRGNPGHPGSMALPQCPTGRPSSALRDIHSLHRP